MKRLPSRHGSRQGRRWEGGREEKRVVWADGKDASLLVLRKQFSHGFRSLPRFFFKVLGLITYIL